MSELCTLIDRHCRQAMTPTVIPRLTLSRASAVQEARRLMLSREVDASRVSFDVGYESASQFSREYRRLFGVPPARDAAEARRTLNPRREEMTAGR